MELIDKSKLIYTYVYPEDDPTNRQLAILVSDIQKIPTIMVTKNICGKEIPLENLRNKSSKEPMKLDIDDALVIAHLMIGLTNMEKEAIEVICDYIENQIENKE